jgi:glucose-6-phosphate dehydrogenase assembly protein OpcA
VTPAGAAPVMLRHLGQIEAELARLWQATVDSRGPGEVRAILRAATFNLLAIVTGEEDRHQVSAALAALMVDHPGRFLVLSVDPLAREDRLQAWVAMHCRAIGGGSQVCGEEIVIEAAGPAVERLGAAVAALLLPECPTVAWWRGGPGPAAALLDRLAPSLDALLLDGEGFELSTLVRWVDRPIPVGDLAWLRGASWRGWTADCFEPEDLRPALAALSDLRVDHGPGATLGARLYVGWLAARLGWGRGAGLAPAGGGWQGSLAGAEGAVSVTLRAVPHGAAMTGVALESAETGVRCALTRQGDEAVTLEVGRQGDLSQRCIRQPEPDDATLVGRWLDRLHRDPLYTDALAALATLG